MSIPSRVQNILDTVGQAAAEVSCSVEKHREFVGVNKTSSAAILNFHDRFPYLAENQSLYHVYRFRVRSVLIENEDTNVWTGDFVDHQKIYLTDESLLESILAMWLPNLELLGLPAECNIPI